MEEVSNTRVIVIVELKALVGVLAINIPPPPSDRFWFVPTKKLKLKILTLINFAQVWIPW
jgi:hypothetical protein